MRLKSQKRIASRILKVGSKRVIFNNENLQDVKEAITRLDIRSLIKRGMISSKPKIGISRFRIRKAIIQKRKGRMKGEGSRKGKKGARLPRKNAWMAKIRVQRGFIKDLKNNGFISTRTYREMYNKSKGGFFRSKRHIKLYMDEKKLGIKK